MLDKFRESKCNIELEKRYFLHSHLDYFLKCSLRSLSKEQDKKFHQDMKEIKKKIRAAGASTCGLLFEQARQSSCSSQ